MYISPNFRTKKEFLAALAAGKEISVFSPGPFDCPRSGSVGIEGPHYPRPHSWYASAVLADGRIVSVDGKSVEKIRAAADKKAGRVIGNAIADAIARAESVPPAGDAETDRAYIADAESRGMISAETAAMLREFVGLERRSR